MTDWKRGGITGSLNRWVSKEVGEQLRDNPVARRARYRWPRRALRLIFSIGTFWRFMAAYLLVDLAMLDVEGVFRWLAPATGPSWAEGRAVAELLTNVPNILISAQVGILGVISLALALVTLIAQRDDASTDVQVYYHESLFFEIAGSCLALIGVMTIQLLWPLQFGFHLVGGGGHAALFKLVLLALHVVWFTTNLAAVAHFITATFRFVQRSARERMREVYTVNVIIPREMTERVRETMYSAASLSPQRDGDEKGPAALFGMAMSEPYEIELSRDFTPAARVVNLHVRPAQWVIRRWIARCTAASGADGNANPPNRQPQLWFSPRVEGRMTGRVAWCRRSGGVPLTPFEKTVLRIAFRFGRASDEE